jgi:hypothetical protein
LLTAVSTRDDEDIPPGTRPAPGKFEMRKQTQKVVLNGGLSSTKSNVKANSAERRILPGAHKPKEQPAPTTSEILNAAAAQVFDYVWFLIA